MRLRTLCLLLASLCLYVSSSAQIEVDYPYNPDSDGNEVISIEDLLDLLPYYGGEFTVDEILIDGTNLTEFLTELSVFVASQQMEIDALQEALTNAESTVINNYHTHQYSGSFNESVLASLARTGACIQNMDATELIFHSGNTAFEEVCLPGMFFGERPGVQSLCLIQFSFDHSNLANSNWSCPSFIFHSGSSPPPYSGGLRAWGSNWNNCILNGAKFGNDSPPSTEGYSLGEINSNDWNYFGYSDRFEQCSFQQSTMERCEFKGIDLKESEFYASSMRNCVFQNSNLRDVDFNSADLTGSRFSFVNLQGASFYNAILAEVEFKDVYGCLEIVDLPADCECIENDNGTHDISVGGTVFNQIECAPVDYQGRVYETVSIGNTCWFAENLSAEFFTDGTPLTDYKEANLSSFDFADEYYGPGFYRAGDIDGVDGDGESWLSEFMGYDQGIPGFQTLPSSIDSVAWANQHGLYYNMMAIDSELDLCPTGWHIPSEYDWSEAIESICGSVGDGLSFPSDDSSIQLAQETVNWSVDWSDFQTTFSDWCEFSPYSYHEGTNGTGLRIRPSLSFRTQHPPEYMENLPYPYPPQWFGGFVIKAVDNYQNYILLWGPEAQTYYEIQWSSLFKQRGVHIRCVQDPD